jgi:tetratricopeptide (TPR) repeat protein
MQRRHEERGDRRRPSGQAKGSRVAQDSAVRRVLGLQASAGNAAVASMLQRQPQGAVAEASRTWERATSAYQGGDYGRAVRLFERLTRSPAATAEVMPDLVWSIAVAKARLGDVDGAMTAAMTYGQYRPADQPRLLELLHRIQTEQAGALYQQAVSAYEAERYRESLRIFEGLVTAPAVTPEILPDLIWSIAATQARLGRVDDAYTSAMTYGQYRPNELGRLLDLIARIGGERATAAASRTYERAVRAYEQGHYGRAVQLLEQVAGSSASTAAVMPDIVWSIAVSKARLGDIDGAMTAAMTYGEYRPQDQQRLLQMIDDIRAGRRAAAH